MKENTDINKIIGERIIEIRSKKGISQDLLAEKIGIARTNLSRIENGKHGAGLQMLHRIAIALDCKIDFVE